MSVNKVMILGNLGANPEVKFLANGGAVANLSIATSRSWVDKNTNQKQEKTEWHRVIFYGKQAETIGQFVSKGRQLFVEGRMETRKWTDNNGVDRYTTEVIGESFSFVGAKPESAPQSEPSGYAGASSQKTQANAYERASTGAVSEIDDDIPF